MMAPDETVSDDDRSPRVGRRRRRRRRSGAVLLAAAMVSVVAAVATGGSDAGASGPVRVDFGPVGVAPAPGHVRWGTGQFREASGMGFVDPASGRPEDRPSGSAVRRDGRDPAGTHVRLDRGPGGNDDPYDPSAFEVAVPAGRYEVAVTVGDVEPAGHHQNIDIEGVTAVIGWQPTPVRPTLRAERVVQVDDGRLTLSPRGRGDTKLISLEIEPVDPAPAGAEPVDGPGSADAEPAEPVDAPDDDPVRPAPTGPAAQAEGIAGDAGTATVVPAHLADDDTLWVATFDNDGDWWEHHGLTRTWGPQDQRGTLDSRRFRPVPAPGFGRGDALRIDFNPDGNARIRSDDAQFGVRWSTAFESMGLGAEMRDEAYLQYRLFVPDDFPCETTGGKLPGLAGNPRAVEAPSSGAGGGTYDGTAWSGRIMWAPDCRMVSYLYVDRMGAVPFTDRRNDDGRYVGFRPPWTRPDGTPARLRKGEWNTIGLHYRMNTPGRRDGVHRAWLNGDMVVDSANVIYRTNAHRGLGINEIRFDFFYGGAEGAPRPSRLFLDDVVLADGPIG